VKVYLEDPYLSKVSARVLLVKKSRGRRGYVVLDRTVFHPLGGGQPSDRGVILGEGRVFRVKKAIVSGGVLMHYGSYGDRYSFQVGEEVEARIDWEFRYLVMRLHTAGHILDYAVASVHGGPVETLSAFHGPPDAFLEYRLRERPRVGEIEAEANRVVEEDVPVRIRWVDGEELASAVYNAPNLARVPVSKRYRIVEIEGVNAMPCTGTHVARTGEVGRIRVEWVEATENGWRLHYSVAEPG